MHKTHTTHTHTHTAHHTYTHPNRNYVHYAQTQRCNERDLEIDNTGGCVCVCVCLCGEHTIARDLYQRRSAWEKVAEKLVCRPYCHFECGCERGGLWKGDVMAIFKCACALQPLLCSKKNDHLISSVIFSFFNIIL